MDIRFKHDNLMLKQMLIYLIIFLDKTHSSL